MNLSFAHPHMFWLLVVIALLPALKLIANWRSERLLRRAVSPKLLHSLAPKRDRLRSWAAFLCECLALVALVVALARPQMGFVEETVKSSGRSVILALDTSRSMLAEDIKPNRLDRTKLIILHLIKKLPSDRIGLLAFAGKPFLQAPITEDHDALREALEQCDVNIIPRGGSNLAEAINLAVETFTGKLPDGTLVEEEQLKAIAAWKDSAHILLVFSDGEELEGAAQEAAKRAAAAGVTIITVGVGTKEGALIPAPTQTEVEQFLQSQMRQGRSRPMATPNEPYIRDETGKLVKSILQEQVLVELAATSRGLYVPLLDMMKDDRVELLLKKLETTAGATKTTRRALDRFYLPVLVSCLFFLAAICIRILPQARK